MKYNALLRRKGQFVPIATALELEFPDDMGVEEKERIAATHLVGKAGLYVELEPIGKNGKTKETTKDN